MWRSIVAFELKQQLRSPAFAVVSVISSLLVFGSVTTERIRIGPEVGGLRNGAEAILQIHGVWSLFFAFTAVAFAADAVLRDEQTRFSPVLRATPLRKADYFWGRFAGAFAAVLICFLSVPAGLLAAGYAPWLDAQRIGPVLPGAYATALFGIAIPNLFVLTSVVFALATSLRSSMAGYVAAIGLLMIYGLDAGGDGLAPWLEPFGFTAAQQGGLWLNRLVWTGLAAGVLVLAYTGFKLEPPERRTLKTLQIEEPPTSRPSPAPAATDFDPAVVRAQLAARLRWEIRAVFGSPAFLVIAGLGAANIALALWTAAAEVGESQALIARAIESFRLVPMTVAIVYAGELVWAEREAGVQPLTASTPTPDYAFLLPKAAALYAVLLALLAATGVAGFLIDSSLGDGVADLGAWLRLYLLPRSFDWLVFATLALALQTVAPSKLAGWGWMVLFLISSLAMEQLGLNNGLYRYGGRLDGDLAALIARDPKQGALLRVYWGSFAVLLTTMAYALYGRGRELKFREQAAQASRRFRGPLGALASIALVTMLLAGWLLAFPSSAGLS